MNQKDLKSSKEIRAKRLNILIKITGLSRTKFGKKYGIALGNFQNWCNARFGGLTEAGAKKCLHACKMEGVETTVEWLMYGVEPGPKMTERFCNEGEKNTASGNIFSTNDFSGFSTRSRKSKCEGYTVSTKDFEITAITREILLFKQNYNQQVLEMMVPDDSMLPYYKAGEYVAGKYFDGNNLLSLINQDCIVQLEDGNLILRNLKVGSNNNLFNLACHNIHAADKPVIYDVKITCAAPVMWLRRKAINN